MRNVSRQCAAPNCERPSTRRGYCNKHYRRLRRNGTTELLRPVAVSAPGEEWRNVVGYEGWYSVSNLGRLRSDRYGRNTYPGKVLSPSKTEKGYLRTILYRGKHSKKCKFIHRLIAEAFLGQRPKGQEVNHIDANKSNNRLGNLEYVTKVENQQHAIALGLVDYGTFSGEKHYLAKLTESDVREIRKLRGKVSQKKLAERYGVAQTGICKIQLGYTWRHVK
jgi:hypothetical protein